MNITVRSPRVWENSHTTSQPRPQPRPVATPSVRSVPRSATSVAQPAPPSVPDVRTPPPRTSHDGQAHNPSPSYFGLPAKECFSTSGAQQGRGAFFSPPSSQVRSTAAASPRVVPVDQNPHFEAFRRQSEQNAFNLGRLSSFDMTKPSTSRSVSHNSNAPIEASSTSKAASPVSPTRSSGGGGSSFIADTLVIPRSPKRMLSSDSATFPDRPRRLSPASFSEADASHASNHADSLPNSHSRSSLPPHAANSSITAPHQRAETLPANVDGSGRNDSPIFVTPQHVVNLLDVSRDEILLLDLRVSTQYARSRITQALNLCIPTTLLKRPAFNVHKLADTFSVEEQRSKFERWRACKYIIVYDANSTQPKDAAICINTLKKFATEGWAGSSYIIRGGFAEFSQKFPSYVEAGSGGSSASRAVKLSLDSNGPAVAPVIGGCPMPATQNAANPFFGNIRQNMDLIGGVGRMSIKHPSSISEQIESELPTWLKRAVDDKDAGKLVSDRFLHIEQREQKRMQEALSGNVTYGTPGAARARSSVQIAGIEKGSKNRYNNIWPYEHSRVKLQDVSAGGCDYINANHVKAAWSNKRYIATQGPIPATFIDFWNVVWQEDVRVIVMLTAEKEGGQVKAHNYWDAKTYGHFHLNFLSEHRASLELAKIHQRRHRPSMSRRRSTNPTPGKQLPVPVETSPISPTSDQPYVIVRKFTLSHADHPFERMREITQLQYSSWPDFGAPAHPAHLLGLVEQCDAVVRSTLSRPNPAEPDPPEVRPVLVHCSAGCGRTGTFCTVDSVIDMLKRQRLSRAEKSKRTQRQATPMDIDATGRDADKERDPFFDAPAVEGSWVERDDLDLIEKTVEDFRLQRLSMVQSLRQFVLCYESVLEWIVAQEQAPKSA
ncbi:phosphotyrosine-specific ptp2-like protein [Coniosporium apollinis]|uniref:protein-tyrosine-phosphatase n=1 Tax=Coniosporium apollinis TaxID=61459 RepID=A0ABQ9NJP2_9PEZI|nr:phosphotyrosine-specific ptp2-like protein [Coniosporium apollinis]